MGLDEGTKDTVSAAVTRGGRVQALDPKHKPSGDPDLTLCRQANNTGFTQHSQGALRFTNISLQLKNCVQVLTSCCQSLASAPVVRLESCGQALSLSGQRGLAVRVVACVACTFAPEAASSWFTCTVCLHTCGFCLHSCGLVDTRWYIGTDQHSLRKVRFMLLSLSSLNSAP